MAASHPLGTAGRHRWGSSAHSIGHSIGRSRAQATRIRSVLEPGHLSRNGSPSHVSPPSCVAQRMSQRLIACRHSIAHGTRTNRRLRARRRTRGCTLARASACPPVTFVGSRSRCRTKQSAEQSLLRGVQHRQHGQRRAFQQHSACRPRRRNGHGHEPQSLSSSKTSRKTPDRVTREPRGRRSKGSPTRTQGRRTLVKRLNSDLA